ncbi:unnamed protein product [Linum tenue]|uniref:Leucine-rich repeat-containing N-terminal plant-type domain-containing protein n=1 Tax=Linum tenue TaxID=586396 RepID=A0AAV0S4D6_9ROSI|nr:unnamed protein product [Linum tenue]
MSQMKTILVAVIVAALSVVLQGRWCDGCFEDERVALLQLQNSTPSSLFEESDDDDCCAWERVECNPVSGRVMQLSLNFSREGDHWQPNASLFLPFRDLTGLYLPGNNITGQLLQINAGLSRLEILDLGSNYDMNISILSSLAVLPSLRILDLAFSDLQGSADLTGLENFRKLEKLDLTYSTVNDDGFLETVGKISSLKSLVLQGCGLGGSIEGLCQLKSLQELDISSNHLYGMLPSCLANLTSLKSLDLSYNRFTGDMANSPLRSLLSIKDMLLSGNHFQIPVSLTPLFNHTNLQKLEARNNNLTVYANEEYSPYLVPKFQLQTLDLSSHSLPGQPFPKFLYHQKHLRFLDLSHGSFQGGFPSWLLENNTNLVQLILADNSLSGSFQQLPNHPHLKLSSLDISSNNLEGKLPQKLAASFPKLSYVNMSDNEFVGRIPKSFGTMKYLQTLVLSNNRLSGNIPSQFGKSFTSFVNGSLNGTAHSNNGSLILINNLDWLQLNGNLLSGRIPNSLLNCTYLTMLDLSNNNLSGPVPNWIGNQSSLRVLDLSQNSLSGFLPKGIFSPNMKELYLSRNQLEGPLNHLLPLDNVYSDWLMTIDLSHNHFTGTIPGWIQMYSQLSYLLLNNNNFQGRIPVEVCKLELLSLLDLSHNNLSGHILPCISSSSGWSRREEAMIVPPISSQQPQQPLEFTTKGLSHSYQGTILVYISGIDLSNNSFTGEIPPAFGNFTNIKVLNLSHNSLSGPIPSTFSNLKQIESLDLSYNNLNGSIPNDLVELNFLGDFSVAHNNLSGKTLGNVAQFGTFGESSYQGNDLLCGWPLPKDCPGTRVDDRKPETPSQNYEESGGDGFIDMGAFRVSFSGSYIVMLLGIVTVLLVNPHWRRAWFYCVEAAAAGCYYFVVDHLPVPMKYRVSHPRCF